VRFGETKRSPRSYARLLCLCAALAAAPAYAADEAEPLEFITAREWGMGGRHVALADDDSALLTNPAALVGRQRSLTLADLGIRLIGPVFDIADLVAGGGMDTSTLTQFLDENDYKVYAGLDVTGPLALGYTGGGLGFGIFNKTKFIVNVASATSINVRAGEDLLLAGGYARRFELGNDHALDAGAAAKGFVRGQTKGSRGIIETVGLASNPAEVLNDPFTLTTGVGIDLGLRWSRRQWAAGLVCRDLFSPALATTYASASEFFGSGSGDSAYVSLPRSLDVGAAWTPELGRLGEIMDSLVVAADYKDILDLFSLAPRNPILNVSLGVESKVLNIVTLRAGIADALLAAGVGIDLSVFTISLSVFGTELGLEPGDRPCYNLLVDFKFKY
jgi:hypothetical protein